MLQPCVLSHGVSTMRHVQLQVGNVGLTVTEQRSHFSLWCITSAPLLAGTDLEHATADTLAILTAPELLEINQVCTTFPVALMQRGISGFVCGFCFAAAG